VLKMEGHGREEIIEGVDISRTVGWFTTVYPFVLDVSVSADEIESLVGVKEALRRVPDKGIGYGILKYLSEEKHIDTLNPEIAFNYLGDFGSGAGDTDDSVFSYAAENLGAESSEDNANDIILDVSGILVDGELGISIRYATSRYHAETINNLAETYRQKIEHLVTNLSENKTSHLTISDLTFKGLSVEELSVLNADETLEDVYELSPLQEGIYYHWLAEGLSSLYFEQTSYRVHADSLEVEKLQAAFDNLVARHGVLRTGFSNDYAGTSLQIVRKKVPGNFSYELIDSSVDAESYVRTFKEKDREKGFDLTAPSQIRLHVIELSRGIYELIWSHHHILMDGWCIGILVNDFNKFLTNQMFGTKLDFQPVAPYSNYMNWLRTINKQHSVDYWSHYLENYTDVAEIPFKTKDHNPVYSESNENFQLEDDLFEGMDSLCKEIGITHNTFIQGVWGYLLSQYNNTTDIVFGSVVSGRPANLPGIEEMIGLFINTIPVRVRYEPEDTPVRLLQTISEHAIQCTPHHYLNLSEIQSQSEVGANLINHIVIFGNYVEKDLENKSVFERNDNGELSIEPMEVFEQTNYDFNLTIFPGSDFIRINIKFNQNFYSAPLIGRIKNHFSSVVKKFIEQPNQQLDI
ncbi:MAG: condensation domain-containing protein, partial [Cyclobacteriaceae bacterium]